MVVISKMAHKVDLGLSERQISQSLNSRMLHQEYAVRVCVCVLALNRGARLPWIHCPCACCSLQALLISLGGADGFRAKGFCFVQTGGRVQDAGISRWCSEKTRRRCNWLFQRDWIKDGPCFKFPSCLQPLRGFHSIKPLPFVPPLTQSVSLRPCLLLSSHWPPPSLPIS